MEIDPDKLYIVYKTQEAWNRNAYVVSGSELEEWMKDDSLKEDDVVYEVAKKYRVKIIVDKRVELIEDVI